MTGRCRVDEQTLTDPEIARTLEDILQRHPAFIAHERFIADRLAELAHRCYQHGGNEALLSLKATPEVAREIGRGVTTVKSLAAQHDIGWKANKEWLFQPDDVARLRAIVAASKPGPKRNVAG